MTALLNQTSKMFDKQHQSETRPETRIEKEPVDPLFAQDVLKSGWLQKRGKSRTWKRRWFVLRPNQLTYYKDEREYKVKRIIQLEDIVTVARRKGCFILFTSQKRKQYHLRAESESKNQEWVDALKSVLDDDARSLMDLHNDEGPSAAVNNENADDVLTQPRSTMTISSEKTTQRLNLPSLSMRAPSSSTIHKPVNTSTFTRPKLSHPTVSTGSISQTDLSVGFTSEASDGGDADFSVTSPPLPPPVPHFAISEPIIEVEEDVSSDNQGNSRVDYKNLPPVTDPISFLPAAPERIIESGTLLRLGRRYNQWRRFYTVLTNKRMLFYKLNKQGSSQNSQQLLDPNPFKSILISDMLDAVEVDPMSRNEIYCFMLVTSKRQIRFCCQTEDELIKWLASIKGSILSYRKENKTQ